MVCGSSEGLVNALKPRVSGYTGRKGGGAWLTSSYAFEGEDF